MFWRLRFFLLCAPAAAVAAAIGRKSRETCSPSGSCSKVTLAQNPALTCSLYRLRACAWRAGSKGRAAVACCCCCCWSPLLLPHTCGVAAERGPPGCLPPHAVVGGVWRPRGVTGCCCCCCRAAGQEGLSPPLSFSPMVGGGEGGGGDGWLLTWRGGDVRTLGRLARNWDIIIRLFIRILVD